MENLPEKPNKDRQINVRLPDDLYLKLKAESRKGVGQPISQIVRVALDAYLNEQLKKDSSR